ncbi:hypothetical protein [Pedobacter sp. L105]|uniref:hypothetical protein n=1 Tax=Pedobacter sp. L105 TaxID=1641871 RepID=UPI00131CD629|nr:hypothetical protein [Pedobacter sp. L105]
MKIVNEMSVISQQYYIMAEHWASDLEFFKLETAFLRGLLEDHFMELCDQSYIEELKRYGKLLMVLDKDEYECEQMISLQLTKLGLLAKYSLLDNKEELKESQGVIECIMMSITKEYRQVKKDIFRLIEILLKADKLKN